MLQLYQRPTPFSRFQGPISTVISQRHRIDNASINDLQLQMVLSSAKNRERPRVPAFRYVTTPSLSGSTSSVVNCHGYDSGCGVIPSSTGLAFDVRRKNASRESTDTLKAWLIEHRKNPYPTKADKIMLAIITRMTLTQVSTWFANARRRLKKENKNGEWGLKEPTAVDDDGDSKDLSVSCETKSSVQCTRLESMADDDSDCSETEVVVSSTTTTSKQKLWSVDDMVASSTDRQRESFACAYKEYIYTQAAAISVRSSEVQH